MWRKNIFDIYVTEYGTTLTTILPILFLYLNTVTVTPEPLNRNESGRFGALKSDSTHHFFRNACTKSGSLRFSQFSGCWPILSVYIHMSFDFPFFKIVRSSVSCYYPYLNDIKYQLCYLKRFLYTQKLYLFIVTRFFYYHLFFFCICWTLYIKSINELNIASECIIFIYKNVASKSFYKSKIHYFPLMLMQRNEKWYTYKPLGI